MATDSWILTAVASLNVLAILLWFSGRFRLVVSPSVPAPARLPERVQGRTPRKNDSMGRGESRLVDDLERFRKRMQENEPCRT